MIPENAVFEKSRKKIKKFTISPLDNLIMIPYTV